MEKIFSIITEKLRLASICTLCNQFHRSKLALCTDCLHDLPYLNTACEHCGQPLPDADFLICGACLQEKPYFDTVRVAYRYEEPLRSLIHQFKYEGKLYLGNVLASLMEKTLDKENLPECLIPVPMHLRRLRKRGFNQAAILAQKLSKKWKIPCDLFSATKVQNTAPQAHLDADNRLSNLQFAFQVDKLPYQHVALVDDLLTTGSTANALAFLMKKQGVNRVTLYCIARAVEAKYYQ